MKNVLFIFSILMCNLLFAQVDCKKLDKSLVKITETLYASRFEVSNGDYLVFLQSLHDENKTKEYKMAAIDSVNWLNKKYRMEPFVQHYHQHDAFRNYPVLNISHDAAVLYCQWLTEKYNQNPKRKYVSIKFKLPTEEEWMQAARGGNEKAIYPWKGDQLKTKKGMMQCNYSSGQKPEEKNGHIESEGYGIPAPVEAYYENGYGLYNVSGNAAEMLDQPTITKGGSWYEGEEKLKINSKSEYDGKSSIYVGFRVFAEVRKK